MSSPYSLGRTVRWPFDFLMPTRGKQKDHFPAPIHMAFDALQAPVDKQLRLIFLGDVMVSQSDIAPVFPQRLCERLATADWVIATCEAPVARVTRRKTARYFSNFLMPFDYLGEIIDRLGIAPQKLALSLANNHIADYGLARIYETLEIFAEVGIVLLGIRSQDAAGFDYLDRAGVRLGIFAWTQWMNNKDVAYQDIQINWQSDLPLAGRRDEGTGKADFYIGIPHWGYEFRHIPRANERQLAQELLRHHTFDLIIGSHTHSVQGLECVSDRLCAYSLGNFVFTQAPYIRWLRAWSLGIVPVLTIDAVSRTGQQPRVAAYQIEFFYHHGSVHGTEVVEFEALSEGLHKKIDGLLGRLFQ